MFLAASQMQTFLSTCGGHVVNIPRSKHNLTLQQDKAVDYRNLSGLGNGELIFIDLCILSKNIFLEFFVNKLLLTNVQGSFCSKLPVNNSTRKKFDSVLCEFELLSKITIPIKVLVLQDKALNCWETVSSYRRVGSLEQHMKLLSGAHPDQYAYHY